MTFTFAAITDLHFGHKTAFRGKLRKLNHLAPELTCAFVRRMNESVRPDMVAILGDLIEDESPEMDAQRYQECLGILGSIQAPVRHVAGNHDTINLSEEQVQTFWKHDKPLHYSFDQGGVHFAVLHTVEYRDLEITVPKDQLDWLAADLKRTLLKTIVLMHHSCADQDVRGNRWFEDAAHVALVKERAKVRRVIADSHKVILVMNGHLHWTHFDVHDCIPYVTVQSLIENLDDDAPGRAADASAIVRIEDSSVHVFIDGLMQARYEHHFA